MAAQQIARNRYRLPYLPGSSVLRSSIPGYFKYAHSPGRVVLGATQTFTVASVPADLSTLIIVAPNGQQITFQFVYNASVQTLGIKIPLPASGASTAAQVATAVLGVLGLPGGQPITGPAVSYPWKGVAVSGQPTKFELDYTVNGTANASQGTQATITSVSTGPNLFGTTQILPGIFGKNFAVLPGF